MAADQTTTDKSIRRRLGRGLGSLLSTPVQIDIPAARAQSGVASGGASVAVETKPSAILPPIPSDPNAPSIAMVELKRIQPNPHQPRQHFDEDALRALSNSIRMSGVMQPIVVRPTPGKPAGELQLIAGERRWRAAQMAGLIHIPAVVRNIDDRTAAEFSLVENLQREDLNPIERAEAFQRLITEFNLTHQEIAERIGLDRTSITNHLRLNELDEFTKDAVKVGRLSLGHAKALLGISSKTDRAKLAAQIVREGWSVREIEDRAKSLSEQSVSGEGAARVGLGPTGLGAPEPTKRAVAPQVAQLEKRLIELLGTKVRLQPGRVKGRGKMVIEFYTFDQFEGLLRRLGLPMESD